MLSYSLGERNILNPAHDVSLLEEYLLTLPKGKKVVFIDEVSVSFYQNYNLKNYRIFTLNET